MKYSPFQFIRDNDAFCQGDLLAGNLSHHSPSFGMIITADCDLAHNKAGKNVSILEIISAEDYLANHWAPLESEKIFKDQLKKTLITLNLIIESCDDIDQLTERSLLDWLKASNPESIIAAMGDAAVDHSDLLHSLNCVSHWYCAQSDIGSLQILNAMWRELKHSSKSIRNRLMEIFDPNKGKPDIYFLPSLPSRHEVGFVVHLRGVRAVARSEIYLSALDYRLADRPGGYYRVGRLADDLRFSIVQRMAILFSRIGQPEEFEEAARMANEAVVQSVADRFEEARI